MLKLLRLRLGAICFSAHPTPITLPLVPLVVCCTTAASARPPAYPHTKMRRTLAFLAITCSLLALILPTPSTATRDFYLRGTREHSFISVRYPEHCYELTSWTADKANYKQLRATDSRCQAVTGIVPNKENNEPDDTVMEISTQLVRSAFQAAKGDWCLVTNLWFCVVKNPAHVRDREECTHATDTHALMAHTNAHLSCHRHTHQYTPHTCSHATGTHTNAHTNAHTHALMPPAHTPKCAHTGQGYDHQELQGVDPV